MDQARQANAEPKFAIFQVVAGKSLRCAYFSSWRLVSRPGLQPYERGHPAQWDGDNPPHDALVPLNIP